MSDLFDMSETPTFFLVGDRSRRRSWTPTSARLLATRSETRRGGEDSHPYRVTIGRWEYRDAQGATQTGEGQLDGVWISLQDGPQDIKVLVDPADPTRSQALSPPPGAATLLVVPVMLFFGAIGVVLLAVSLRALTS